MDLREFLGQEKLRKKPWVYVANSAGPSSIDMHLASREPQARSVIALTETYRAAEAASLPTEAGTRVSIGHNLGMVLHYKNLPAKGVLGTVVTVRTAEGDTTTYGDQVFVKWDDGSFFPVQARHLLLAKGHKAAGNYRKTVQAFGDLSDFLRVAGSGTDLVHKATKDLWAFKQDGDRLILERLFDGGGEPLKV